MHSPPRVFKLRDRLTRNIARAHELFKMPQWLINRGIRDIVVFNMKRGRFRLGGPKKKSNPDGDDGGGRSAAPYRPGGGFDSTVGGSGQGSTMGFTADMMEPSVASTVQHRGAGLTVEDSVNDY